MEKQNIFDKASDAIGVDITAKIVDGVMYITPAEAGVLLFSQVALWEDQLAMMEDSLGKLADDYLEKSDDNDRMRDLLEQVVPILENHGYHELAEDIIKRSYPVVGISDDGQRVQFDYNE